MFVVRSVQLALLGAGNASGKAGLDGRTGDGQVNSCATRQDGCGGGTHVRTIEIGAHAFDHGDDVRFRHASIGTRSASLEAGEAFFDALDQRVVVDRSGTRVGIGHPFDNQGHDAIRPSS
ncbi:hypothetical protein [Amycolatopsis sp. NPDC051903]|uniref:hypothetical protein n=1 Tax=Amycolatopsis sp. NPDC051903 TaxID=3363936 RepID=UPI0037A8B222